MAGLPIPTDWDETEDGFITMSVTVPNSLEWQATVKGAIYALTRLSLWDANTGDPTEAAAIARAAFNTVEFNL